MLKRLIVLAALVGLAATDAGAVATPTRITRADQRDVMVTIYNGNLGLVKDVREARFPEGLAEVQFADVAALIDPTTVHLKSLTEPAGLRILEQNYEYDLLTSQKLMEKYVGRKVRLYQGDGTFHEATLLSTNGPIFEINGQIHMGQYGRLVLPTIPENLVARPTLVWLLQNRRAAPHRVEASYLTGGITWKADYVLVLNAGDTASDLTGWVTIDNKSGATYANAALKLVAGDVNRAEDPRRRLKALEAAAVDKRLIYYGAQDYYRTSYGVPVSNQKVGVYLDVKNSKENRLGVPLPRGRVRVYKADAAGSQQFVGEDWIDHTPKDERLRIKMGEAFDLVGERTQRDWKKLSSGVYEVEWEIALRNHKAADQTVWVIEPIPGDWQVLSATHPGEKLEAHTLRFQVPVPKEGAAKLTYRVRLRF